MSASSTQARSSTHTESEEDEALQPASMPPPKAKSKKAARVNMDRAPTVDEVLDPRRPDLSDASNEGVLQSITNIVGVPVALELLKPDVPVKVAFTRNGERREVQLVPSGRR